MIELRQEDRCRIESLINEIARDPRTDEVHVREARDWTWTRVPPDPDDGGIRYGHEVVLSVVMSTHPGREVDVARLLIDDGDLITHVELQEHASYSFVTLAADAFGIR